MNPGDLGIDRLITVHIDICGVITVTESIITVTYCVITVTVHQYCSNK